MKWLPSTFRNRLALAIGAMALLVGLPFFLYVGQLFGRHLLQGREVALRDLARVVAAGVAVDLAQRQRDIRLLGQLAGGLSDARVLQTLKAADPVYAWIGVADPQGVVRLATDGLLVGRNVAERPWFQAGRDGPALGDRHVALLLQSALAPGARDPLYFIDVAVPLLRADGVAAGVLAAHVHWRWAAQVMGQLVPRRSAREQIDVFLVNGAGQIIYPDMPADSAQVPADLPADATALPLRWSDAADYLSVATPVPEAQPRTPLNWRVVVRQPMATALAELRDIQTVLALATVVASVAFMVLAWWGARLISRPLELLARQARRIEVGDESVTLRHPGGGAELQRLSQALQGMAGTLIARKQALEQSNLALERKVAERTVELARSNEALQRQARHDALTGLPNRFATDERLAQEFTRFRRTGVPYALMVLDIDHFKRVNDTHGHAVGDEVLRHVAGVVRQALRSSDFVGRSGGEEFLVLLPDTRLGAALEVAEKVRCALEHQPVAAVGMLTLSAGVSEVQAAHADADMAVRQADQALYRAKHSGRNRVERAG